MYCLLFSDCFLFTIHFLTPIHIECFINVGVKRDGGDGEKAKKKFMQGKMPRKKIVQRRWERKKFMRKEGPIVIFM